MTAGFFLVVDGGETEAPFDSIRFVMMIIAIFMPIAMIWVGALAVRASRTIREESRRLQAAISAMRQSYLSQQGGHNTASVEQKLEEIVAAQRKTQTTLTTFTSIRPQTAPADDRLAIASPDLPQDQASLALGTPAENLAPPLSVADFIRALNFPETAEDKEGFRALRRALSDRKVSRLVHAAQDILTLLSQDGIYMDDLRPDRAKPEVWRNFAKGERGRAVAPLGGVRDRSSLALASGRMKQDAIFRDAVHHFLRKFDKTFSEFEETATDEEIATLSDSRTARAFMLLGRVAGTFD
jgi:type II secretory pathway pseudopilin PulG